MRPQDILRGRKTDCAYEAKTLYLAETNNRLITQVIFGSRDVEPPVHRQHQNLCVCDRERERLRERERERE